MINVKQLATSLDNNLCIYHGNCADGFSAAWVLWKVFTNLKINVEFHAGVYQTPPPDVTGKVVYILDFSYKRPVLLEMATQAKVIIIIDHHKSAMEDLVDLPSNVIPYFSLDNSGAMLTWNYFHPGIEPPLLLRHVEDRDLWKFHLRHTREIQAALFSYPYEFEIWDHLMTSEKAYDQLIIDGTAIERKHFKDISELLGVTTRDMVIGGYRVPVANLPYTMASDAGHELAKGQPFAACYWDTPEGRVFSLRSNKNSVDVAEVAKQYGGGGHRNAAGFRVSFAQAQLFEV